MSVIFHSLSFFQLSWTFFAPRPNKFGRLLICEAIPNAITSDYHKIVISFERHPRHVRERGHLMFFAFFNVTIRSCLCRRSICFLSSLFLFLFELFEQGRVLVFPISYRSRHGNNTLYSSIIDKSAGRLNSLHLTFIVRFVIVAKLCDFASLIYEDCSRVT